MPALVPDTLNESVSKFAVVAVVVEPLLTVAYKVSLPAPPSIVSKDEKVTVEPDAPPNEPSNASSPDVPTLLSIPVVSVKVEPVTGVEVEPLPVVASIVAGVTVAAVVALTAVPPKVKPVTPPVVANLVATVPLDPVSSGHEAL